MSDFQTADINELLNEKPEPEKKTDVNKFFSQYDKELLSFKPNIRHSREWPSPIRKRRCIK